MASHLEVQIEAPFELGDAVLLAELVDGRKEQLLLQDGYLRRDDLPVPAKLVRILIGPTQTYLSETARAVAPADARLRDVKHVKADVQTLFERGVAVPVDGRLRIVLLWGAPCLTEVQGECEGKRFSSWEHVECAADVGLLLDDDSVPSQASFTAATLLTVGKVQLPFGKIIALAGDFYAHFDDIATHEFEDAWPQLPKLTQWFAGGDYRSTTLAGDTPENIKALLEAVERDQYQGQSAASEFLSQITDTLGGNFSVRRYLALASQNICHFNSPQPGRGYDRSEAMSLYLRYHKRALDQANAAQRSVGDRYGDFLKALAIDAFGCHFLTDTFASGHMRVPRRLLAERYGILQGALYMSKRMHDEDNALGLWCRPRQGSGPIWRTYGDGKLRSSDALEHKQQVREAVRRSSAEVFAMYMGETTPPQKRAEALVPIPLPPGEAPSQTDIILNKPGPRKPNHYPLFWFDAAGRVIERKGSPSDNSYHYVGEEGAASALEVFTL